MWHESSGKTITAKPDRAVVGTCTASVGASTVTIALGRLASVACEHAARPQATSNANVRVTRVMQLLPVRKPARTLALRQAFVEIEELDLPFTASMLL
jgi:hypothetical protein